LCPPHVPASTGTRLDSLGRGSESHRSIDGVVWIWPAGGTGGFWVSFGQGILGPGVCHRGDACRVGLWHETVRVWPVHTMKHTAFWVFCPWAGVTRSRLGAQYCQ